MGDLSKDENKIKFGLYINTSDYLEIKTMADCEGRSVSNMARHLLLKGLEIKNKEMMDGKFNTIVLGDGSYIVRPVKGVE